MAEPADINVDELRRRARRRLVGAVVLALGVAVIVPMLLETEQKPLGEDVSVKIPPVDEGRFVNRLTDKGDKGAPDATSSSAAPSASPPAPPPAGAERSSKYDTHVPDSDASSTSANTAERAAASSAASAAPAPSSRVAPAGVATERGTATSASAAKAAEAAKGTPPQGATESTTATTESTKAATASTKTAAESTKAATESKAGSESTKTAAESRTATGSTEAASESPKSASEPARVAAAASSSTTGRTPATVAHGHEAFAVQLAAFSENKGANALAGRLKRAGYAAYTEPLKTSKGTLWRVRVGPYPSREAAAAARDKLKTEGQSGIVAAVK